MRKIGEVARKIFKDKFFVGISVMLLTVILVVIVTEHILCLPAYIVAISAVSLIAAIVFCHALY